jgi:GT2 family glycosyltransferase
MKTRRETQTRYRLATVDLARPLPAIALDGTETGVGLTIRLDAQPIGFVLRELPPGAVVEPAAVAELLGHSERVALLRERIQRELLPVREVPVARPAPSITAVVCTHDRPVLLARCLASLVALQAPALDILVVDNAPPDGATRDTVASFPGVRYVQERITGLDFARNRALEESTAEFVAYFDDDVTVDAGWLDGFLAAWTAHPDAGAITGPVLPLELVTRAQIEFERLGGFGHRFQRIRFGPQLAGNDVYPCGPGIFGTGCNMAFRRELLRALGGFDEALDTGARLPGGGDLDIFYRVVRAGHAIVSEPGCLVLHQHRREYDGLRHQLWTWGLGLMAFVAKSYRAEPSQRPRFRRLLAWWVASRGAMLVRRARGGGDARPIDLVLAELAGGVVGLCGQYGRSRRRVERLRGAAAMRPSLASRGAG